LGFAIPLILASDRFIYPLVYTPVLIDIISHTDLV